MPSVRPETTTTGGVCGSASSRRRIATPSPGVTGVTPVAGQRLDDGEPLAHADTGPDRPLDAQAAAVRILLRDLGGEVGQPLVGGRVVRLAAQAGPADDAAEGDQQLAAGPGRRRRAPLAGRRSSGAKVCRNAAPSRLLRPAGSLRPAPCSTAVTGPSSAVTSSIARRTSAGSVTSARAYRVATPASLMRRRLVASSSSCAGSDRPSSASFAPLSVAIASAHSAVMPLPPPVTSSTSVSSSAVTTEAGRTGMARSVGTRRVPSGS